MQENPPKRGCCCLMCNSHLSQAIHQSPTYTASSFTSQAYSETCGPTREKNDQMRNQGNICSRFGERKADSNHMWNLTESLSAQTCTLIAGNSMFEFKGVPLHNYVPVWSLSSCFHDQSYCKHTVSLEHKFGTSVDLHLPMCWL